jgi:hypothetical protein
VVTCFGNSFTTGESATKELPCGGHIPGGTQHGVDQIAFPVHGAIQVAPFAFHLYVRFVHVPTSAEFPLAFAAETFASSLKPI